MWYNGCEHLVIIIIIYFITENCIVTIHKDTRALDIIALLYHYYFTLQRVTVAEY